MSDKSKFKRRKCPKDVDDDNDCASLAWLLNFRLDELVNIKVPEEEPHRSVKEPKMEVPDVPPTSKKPPYTYPELIERALRENGELTVSAIYQWISDRFPYYNANDERWKNSIRHNLSINPHFRKGARAPHGAGHLWSLAANALDLLPSNPVPDVTTRVLEEAEVKFVGYPKVTFLERAPQGADHLWSLAANALDLLPSDPEPDMTSRLLKNTEVKIVGYPKVIVLDEAAIAAASILPDQELFTGSTMFLNPVSTEQVVRECGLITVD